MDLLLRVFVFSCLSVGLKCVHQSSWLFCPFIDVSTSINNEQITEYNFYPRDAMLQFGQKGDSPVIPHVITFLITGTKLDLRDYFKEVDENHLECEVRRYSTEGIQVRWPVRGAQEYDRWFICTLKHKEGLFTLIAFLRHTPAAPPPAKEDYQSNLAIEDRQTLTTTVSMVLQTSSPSVHARLQYDQKLHCAFAIDHQRPNFNLEWQFQRRGERTTLFSHASHSQRTQGKGVDVKALTTGDASLSLLPIKMRDEGTYVCSVSVTPLFASQNIALHIEESPRVSLNVGPTLTLREDEEQKVICLAEGYYPLDVEMEWYQEIPGASGQRVGAPLPKKLQEILFSSHKHNQDGTYSLSSFFYLKGALQDSESQISCRVSHASLHMPIRKSFTLTVHEVTSWMFILIVGLILVVLSGILIMLLLYLQSARQIEKRKPY